MGYFSAKSKGQPLDCACVAPGQEDFNPCNTLISILFVPFGSVFEGRTISVTSAHLC